MGRWSTGWSRLPTSNTASDSVTIFNKRRREQCSRYRQALAWEIRTTKTRLAEAITKDVMEILHYGEESGFGSNGRGQA